MHADTTAVLTACRPTRPLALHARAAAVRRDLTAAQRRAPSPRQTAASAAAVAPGPRAWADELRAVRDAAADPRTTRDRVLDRVVDRLIRDLAL